MPIFTVPTVNTYYDRSERQQEHCTLSGTDEVEHTGVSPNSAFVDLTSSAVASPTIKVQNVYLLP
jgi:hypothetical protein